MTDELKLLLVIFSLPVGIGLALIAPDFLCFLAGLAIIAVDLFVFNKLMKG